MPLILTELKCNHFLHKAQQCKRTQLFPPAIVGGQFGLRVKQTQFPLHFEQTSFPAGSIRLSATFAALYSLTVTPAVARVSSWVTLSHSRQMMLGRTGRRGVETSDVESIRECIGNGELMKGRSKMHRRHNRPSRTSLDESGCDDLFFCGGGLMATCLVSLEKLNSKKCESGMRGRGEQHTHIFFT